MLNGPHVKVTAEGAKFQWLCVINPKTPGGGGVLKGG